MSKKLTRELIAQKVKSDRIQNIKNLNLWGSNIDDVSIIKEMPSLEIISLSVNKIRSLKPLANLHNLKELYLRNNLIADIREVQYLEGCENLKILWLSENPICDFKNYRSLVIQALPQLAKLDDVMITETERENANNYDDYEEEDDNFNKSVGTKVNRYQDVYKEDNEEDSTINQYSPPRKAPTYNYMKRSNEYKNINSYEEDDNYQEPKTRTKRIQTAQVRRGNYYYNDNQYNQNNRVNYNQDSNILQCVLMLLKELSTNELKVVQREITKQQHDYY